MDDLTTNAPAPSADQDEPAVKVGLKVVGVTAVVLLVLFGLYWGGKKLLLTPGADEGDKEATPIQVRLDCPPEQVYTDLQEAFKNPDNVCKLDLSNQELGALPNEIYVFKNLAILNANNNRLAVLTPYVGYLTKMTTLDLSHNQLTDLPSQIGHLKEMRHLDLNDNQLSAFVAMAAYMNKLESLNLENNKIQIVDGSIGLVTELTELNLRGNILTTIAEQIGYLNKLKLFDLRDNRLALLPARMDLLQAMELLKLSGNPLPQEEVDKVKKALPNATVNF